MKTKKALLLLVSILAIVVIAAALVIGIRAFRHPPIFIICQECTSSSIPITTTAPTTTIQYYGVTIQESPTAAASTWGACFIVSGYTQTCAGNGVESNTVQYPEGDKITYICTAQWQSPTPYTFSSWSGSYTGEQCTSVGGLSIIIDSDVDFIANYKTTTTASTTVATTTSKSTTTSTAASTTSSGSTTSTAGTSSSTTSTSTAGSTSVSTSTAATTSASTSASTTLSGGGGGGGTGGRVSGGGSTGSGGGGAKPVITPVPPNGYIVNTIGQLNSFNVTIYGLLIKVTDNYVSPTASGFTINNDNYEVNLNQSVVIANSPLFAYHFKLTNISYVPILQTVAAYINATSNINETLNSTLNLTLNISDYSAYKVSPSVMYQAITVENDTSSTPLAPPSYYKISAFNLTEIPNIVDYTNVTAYYPCDLNSKYISISPFSLENGTWYAIKPYHTYSGFCEVNMNLTSDRVVGLFGQIALNTTTYVSTFATTSIEHTTTVAKTSSTISQSQNGQDDLFYLIIVIIIVVLLVVIYYGATKKGKGDKPAPASAAASPDAKKLNQDDLRIFKERESKEAS